MVAVLWLRWRYVASLFTELVAVRKGRAAQIMFEAAPWITPH
ncbi:MAG TPA: hypothetical protein VGN36_07105 [Sphingorhabdus sp.]|nr:hypothetical protein [Sphingorhabdus sp.]